MQNLVMVRSVVSEISDCSINVKISVEPFPRYWTEKFEEFFFTKWRLASLITKCKSKILKEN